METLPVHLSVVKMQNVLVQYSMKGLSEPLTLVVVNLTPEPPMWFRRSPNVTGFLIPSSNSVGVSKAVV